MDEVRKGSKTVDRQELRKGISNVRKWDRMRCVNESEDSSRRGSAAAGSIPLESSKAALTAYHRYMSEVAVLLGANVSTVSAELLEMLNFEINLANVSLAEVDRHDSSSQYTKLTVRELQQLVPQLNWLELLSTFLEASINENELVVSYSMPYFIEMGKLFKRTDRR
ncbi:unnamed protein product [Bemisia tabaci]|uniref:Peptidase M13 N-terminal domain-containing protein n=1 Tax=Bemisia tabaci TaxID=7038 RepID=A0A9P0A6Z1_BEMTA|nr:unnamed protein product [Bemisia tabaci]